MKPLSQVRTVLSFFPQEINYSPEYLSLKKIDFDVFLPSLGMNLQLPFCWNIIQKRELVLSVFMKRYIPRLSLYHNDNTQTFEVIDGKQRLSCLLDFLNNKFTFESDGQEYYFKDLPEEYKRSFASYQMQCVICFNHLSEQDKISWFKFINFAGTPQDAEHLLRLSVKPKDI
jgi:hypothetical protein